jgi:hypothetical protein
VAPDLLLGEEAAEKPGESHGRRNFPPLGAIQELLEIGEFRRFQCDLPNLLAFWKETIQLSSALE